MPKCKVILLCIFLLGIHFSYAQDFRKDLHSLKVKPGIKENQVSKRTYNPLKIINKGVIWTYQKTVSPQLASNCIFEPTCSHFASEAHYHFGFVKASLLSIDRISRCNRAHFAERKTINRNREGKIVEPANFYQFRVQ